MSKKNMVLITALDIWRLTGNPEEKAGTGNQSLYNTLLGYADHGYNIHVFMTGLAHKDVPFTHPNIKIHRVTIRSYKLFKGIKSAILGLLRLFRKREGSSPAGCIQTKPSKVMNGIGIILYSYLFAWEMTRFIKKTMENIDIVFVYGYETNGALAAARLGRIMKLLLITRFQGTEMGQFLDDHHALFKHTVHVRSMTIPADLVVMANDGTQGDKVLDLLGVPRGKYRFYMNGVVKDDVHRPNVNVAEIRSKARVPEKNMFLLYTGRLFYFKRIDRMLEVFARALNDYPKMTLVLIGDGPTKKACENLADKLGITDNVVFFGPLPHDEAMDYLNACDIYVSFYDMSNLTNSLIESCICGKCVVTTDVGGTTDLLTNGVNGVVVKEYDNVEAIAQALVRILRDPDERARLAEGARRRGCELKTWAERMDLEINEVESCLGIQK